MTSPEIELANSLKSELVRMDNWLYQVAFVEGSDEEQPEDSLVEIHVFNVPIEVYESTYDKLCDIIDKCAFGNSILWELFVHRGIDESAIEMQFDHLTPRVKLTWEDLSSTLTGFGFFKRMPEGADQGQTARRMYSSPPNLMRGTLGRNLITQLEPAA